MNHVSGKGGNDSRCHIKYKECPYCTYPAHLYRIRTILKQQLHHIFVTVVNRAEQRRPALLAHTVHIELVLQQQGGDSGVLEANCEMQWGKSLLQLQNGK